MLSSLQLSLSHISPPQLTPLNYPSYPLSPFFGTLLSNSISNLESL